MNAVIKALSASLLVALAAAVAHAQTEEVDTTLDAGESSTFHYNALTVSCNIGLA